MNITVEIGDRVHARKETPQGVIPLEFTVATVAGGVVGGSPLGDLDPADGWRFELLQKADPGLPSVLSDLAVVTTFSPSERVRVVGPVGGVWQTPDGVRVDPASVLAWEPWTD